MSLSSIGILFVLALSLGGQRSEAAISRSRLDSVTDILGEPYDRVHQLIVQDQVDNYQKSIESLETRQVKSLNGLWDFCFDPTNEGHSSKWHERSLVEACKNTGNYYRMPVPSAFNDILSNKTAKNYMGWMWYQKSLAWPLFIDTTAVAGDDHTWILQMESINYVSIIWLQVIHQNKTSESRLVGSHAGGHLPITLDLSSILNDISNLKARIRLSIAVSNILTSDTIPSGQMLNESEAVGRPYFRFLPDFDFFHFAGIMGDVNLIRLPKIYIEDAEFNWQSTGAFAPGFLLTLSKKLEDYQGYQACIEPLDPLDMSRSEGEHCNELSNFFSELSHHDGTLKYYAWPVIAELKKGVRIYLVRVTQSARKNIDIYESKHIITRANMSIDNFFAGATRRQLQGFGMHHEQLFSGRTMSLPAIMKDLYLLKQMGANVIRTSHYPYSRAYLDACDELGLMVIAECPAVGLRSFSETKLMLHKQILKEMMQRDHRHPSIIMWSLANEPESQLPEAREYFEKLVKYTRTSLREFTVDARRPLTCAIAQSHKDDKIGHLFDVIMINRYFGWYDCTALVECVRPSLLASLRGWAEKYPGKKLMLSEFGADTLAGFHSSTSELFSEEYQRDLLVEYEKVFDELIETYKRRANINEIAASGGQAAANETVTKVTEGSIDFLGSMIWNFADFSTHESLMRVGGNKKGVFTRWREPKAAAEAIKQIYRARLANLEERGRHAR